MGNIHEACLNLSAERTKRRVFWLRVVRDPHAADFYKVADAVSKCHQGIGSEMWGQGHSIDGSEANVVRRTIFAACYKMMFLRALN